MVLAIALLELPALAADPSGKLLWSDEFNGAEGNLPDAAKWTYDLGGNGWGNQELENYTDKTENAFVDGQGHLVLRALKNADGRFTSARLKTQKRFSFTYGQVEARMKLPRGQGLWPAFWMLGNDVDKNGWPACGEVDVMENIGREPVVVHGTVHGPGYSGKNGISSQYALPGSPELAAGFHVYAATWAPDRIQFSIDGHVYATVNAQSLPPQAHWVYNHPFFLLLDLAVGGAWPGNPDSTTQFPQDFTIDYVRVYALPAKP